MSGDSVNPWLSAAPTMKTPLFLALDVNDDGMALDLAEKTKTLVGGFKVGPRLTYRYGAELVRKLSRLAPVFVDNKYHDIPSTVLSALRATFESGATFATVHASLGAVSLREVAQLESELNQQRPFRVLSVTVLTSLNATTLPKNWRAESPVRHVQILAEEVMTSGLSGLVCSPEEVSLLRAAHPGAYLVTPGIRLADGDRQDQSRVLGPVEALRAGASALVVGRPIVEAQDPVAAAQGFYDLVTSRSDRP